MKYLLASLRPADDAQALKFDTSWTANPPWTDDKLVVDRELYRFDELVFFTVRIGPLFLLLQKAPSNLGKDLYYGPCVGQEVVDALEANTISVYAAMTSGEIFVLEMSDLELRRYWRIDSGSVPSSWLPAAGVCLSRLAPPAEDTPVFFSGPEGSVLLDQSEEQRFPATLRGHGYRIHLQDGHASARRLVKAVLSMLPPLKSVRHRKRGSDYEVVFPQAEVQTSTPIREGDVVSVYVEETGKAWVRLKTEFDDGRFEGL